MARITFNLKEPNAKKESLIYLIYRTKQDKIKLSTGIKIAPSLWNANKHRTRASKSNLELYELNSLLDNIVTNSKEALYELQKEKLDPSLEETKKKLLEAIRGEFTTTSTSLLVFAKGLIAGIFSRIVLSVMTKNSHGCWFLALGAVMAAANIFVISSSGTGLSR